VAGDIEELITDLRDESGDLDALLMSFGPEVLARPTPATGWSIGDTIGHLWFFDARAVEALTDPDGFVAGLSEVLADPEGYMARHLDAGRTLGGDLLPSWRAERDRLVAAIRDADSADRVPWYGPPMSPMSFTTARLMETWAHGQDVADALGVHRTPTHRLRHICHLGVRTRQFSYAVRGEQVPEAPVYVSLMAPSGELWQWGPPDAPDRVEGPAEDFCLLVTQRRHLADLSLVVTGDAAQSWMAVAQAFAGAPSLTDPSRLGH
jgi:uncharacterized protein (TIGR03084 family)